MLRILLLMLLVGSVRAEVELDEGIEHSWSRPLDECMAAGGLRAECFESLPPNIVAEFEGWEAAQAAVRRHQFQLRQQLGGPTSFGMDVAGGVLKIQSLIAPSVIDKARLRIMTNLDRSTPLTWQDWGNFSGYQYDYSERGSFYRQWWLVNQRTMIFVVYESSAEIEKTNIEEVDRIVKSLTVDGS
jgi:hypothetical protein